MKDKAIFVREAVAEALGRIKDARAVEPLIAALKDDGWSVRWRAADALEKIGRKPLNDKEKALFYIANKEWDMLIKLGKPAVEPLIAALQDEERNVRYEAAEALGKIKDARAVKPLIAALKDEDEYVRRRAAEALGKIKGSRAVEHLIAALKDEDNWVRKRSAEALRKITGQDFGEDY